MAKKVKTLKLTKYRKPLLYNCDSLVTRFETASLTIEVGQASTKAAIALMSSSTRSSATMAAKHKISVDNMAKSELLVLVHAGLIQEWNIFLDTVFSKVVIYYLETNKWNALPSQKIDLKRIRANNLVNMRESISEAAKEAFSRRSYKERIKTLRKIFQVKHSTIDTEMTMHVEVRNIFQHHRGLIRRTDLDKIGQPAGGYFELLDENKKQKRFYDCEKIELSKPEIDNLNGIIKNYSERFEDLS